MEITVEQNRTCEANVALTVPWDEFRRQFEAALRKQAPKARMKGFRAGKVPLKVLEKQFGQEARQAALEHFLGEAFRRAVTDHQLAPVGRQQVEVDHVRFEDGQALEATFQISLQPQFELVEYKGLEIESELEPVLDQEVEAALADLRAQRSRPEPAGEDGLPADGMALCKVRFEKDGEVLLEREGLRFSPGSAPEGVDPAEFEQALSGTQAGDERRLAVRLADDFEREELRGTQAVCHLHVSEVYRIVPPTDEELQTLLEVDSWDALLALARRKIGEAKQQREEARIENALLEGLLRKHSFELPERMIERQIEAREKQLRDQLDQQGAQEDQIEQELEAQRPEMRRQTETSLRAFFLIHAIADKEGIEISEPDLMQELGQIAERNQASFEEVRDYYVKNRLVEQVRLELLERSTRRLLRENARIVQPD